MKRYVCVAFIVILALVYQSQASADSLDGTSWLIQVFIYDAITGRYLGSYIDQLTFGCGQLTTFSGDSGPYWLAPGVPSQPWQAVVTPGSVPGAAVANSGMFSKTYYGVVTNGLIWGAFQGSGYMQYNGTYGVSIFNGCLGLLKGSFFGVPCTPDS